MHNLLKVKLLKAQMQTPTMRSSNGQPVKRAYFRHQDVALRFLRGVMALSSTLTAKRERLPGLGAVVFWKEK